MNVCFCGLGGQGIVLLGVALGEAAARSGQNALQTQSYGAEARGGASFSAVMISKERILDISAENYDALVAISQPAYDRFFGALAPGGMLVFDSDLVKPAGGEGRGIPSTSLAKRKLGNEIYANMVIFGYFVRVGGMVDVKKAKEAIAAIVPGHTVDNNLKAFHIGYDHPV